MATMPAVLYCCHSLPHCNATKLFSTSKHLGRVGFIRLKKQQIRRAHSGNDDHKLKNDEEETTLLNAKIDDIKTGIGGIDIALLAVLPHVLTAAMANFMFGYHIGIINGPLESIAQELGFADDTIMQGFVVSIFIVGAFLGSISGGLLSDTIGRRRTFQVDMIPLVVGPAVSACAHSVNEMLLGRALVGLGIGINASLVPLYISEIAPTKYRGALCSLCQIGTCIGIIVSLLTGIPAQTDPHWWRVMFWIAAAPAASLILAMQFATESPRWLVKKGRWDEAMQVMQGLWGKSEVQKALEELKNTSYADGEQDQASWLEIFDDKNKKVAAIGGSLFFLQQFAGINGVLYFSSSTFHDAGVTDNMTASVAVGVVNLVGALVAIWLMDKEGRRKLLMTSYLGMTLSMGILVLALVAPLEPVVAHDLSVFGTLLYMFTFALGAGPVTGIIIPELCTTKSRAKIMAFSLCVHWISNFLIGLFFLEAVRSFGLTTVYTSFGAVSLLSVGFANAFIIETKGKSLEEIQLLVNTSTTE